MTISDHPPPYVHTDQADELPAYSNSIHLVTLCRRKLEYTAPNVPARKGYRSWNFHWLVLSGTALSVYRPKRSEVKASAARNKDSASSPSPSAGAMRPSSLSSSPSPAVHKAPFRAPASHPLTSLPPSEPTPLVFGGKPHRGNQAAPDMSAHELVKQYAMNGATCVRAYDYFRRSFVLRICADGQQFLVQLNSHPEVLEWLEAFNVAACLCLDLDERPMVESPPYPRGPIHPSGSPTDGRLENSSHRRPEILDANEVTRLFLARSTTFRVNV